MWPYNQEMMGRFRTEIVKNHGGIQCREIARVDWKDRDQVRAFYRGEKILECGRIVGDTVQLLDELLKRSFS